MSSTNLKWSAYSPKSMTVLRWYNFQLQPIRIQEKIHSKQTLSVSGKEEIECFSCCNVFLSEKKFYKVSFFANIDRVSCVKAQGYVLIIITMYFFSFIQIVNFIHYN